MNRANCEALGTVFLMLLAGGAAIAGLRLVLYGNGYALNRRWL